MCRISGNINTAIAALLGNGAAIAHCPEKVCYKFFQRITFELFTLSQSQLQNRWFYVIWFYKWVVNLKTGFSRILTDCQIPLPRCTVTVTIVAQCCLHTEDSVRKQTAHRADLAETIGVDPLIIAVSHFIHVP